MEVLDLGHFDVNASLEPMYVVCGDGARRQAKPCRKKSLKQAMALDESRERGFFDQKILGNGLLLKHFGARPTEL